MGGASRDAIRGGQPLRIAFVLPSPVRVPMGGAKVVYAHAAELARRRHRVTVVGPRRAPGWRGRALEAAVAVRDRLHGVRDAPYYAAAVHATGVETRVVPAATGRYVGPHDAVIATGHQTAAWVRDLPEAAGRKLYFIQGHEAYQSPRALDTWRYGLDVLTCAHWLADAIRDEGVPVHAVVPNAIDHDEFGLDRPIADRTPHVIWLYHRAGIKGPREGIETLELLRERVPNLQATVFAARPPAHALPDWVRLLVRPEPVALRAAYNGAAVLLHTSHTESWPLVPMEGAACGCAIVGYANPGVQEYLRDGESARLVPIGDVGALAEAAHDVLLREADRVRLAEAARRIVTAHTWQDRADAFEDALRRLVTPA